MSRFLKVALVLSLLAVAGCEPMRPPSPAGQKVIDAQTMIGLVNTKVQVKPFNYPVKAGDTSFWDIKVFDIKDKTDGLRQEWKHFAQIPQQPGTTINNTQVLMNGWIISKDGKTFLPQKPTYKQYGSFYTDWTLPRPGDYTLWLEYQPSVAQNEDLSLGELMTRRASYNLPREVGYWNFTAVGETLPTVANASKVTPIPDADGNPMSVYDGKGESVAAVSWTPVKARVGQKTKLAWKVLGVATVENPEIVAIAPDNGTMLHGIGAAPELTFDAPGKWKIWFNYTSGEGCFAAPFVLKVAP